MTAARKSVAPHTETATTTLPACHALAFRKAFLAGISPADVELVVKALLTKAKAGEVSAAKVLFDRCLGAQAVEDWQTEKSVARTEELSALFG